MSGLLGRGQKTDEVGATRTCPHCRAIILASAAVCPQCKGHLRFDAAPDRRVLASPLRIEGTLPGPAPGEAWEYSVVARWCATNAERKWPATWSASAR